MRPERSSLRFDPEGFSLLELLVAVTITALLSTAVIASFRIGLSSWRRGGEFMDRSQRLSAVAELIQKQIGSMSAFYPIQTEPVVVIAGRPPVAPPAVPPSFVGNPREMVFVSDYPITPHSEGGLQLIRYFVASPQETSSPGLVWRSSLSSTARAGMELRIASQPIYRREDFQALTQLVTTSPPSSVTLLEGVEEIKFQYWGEEDPSPQSAADPKMPRAMVARDQWDSNQLFRLPEAVSVQVRFAKPTDRPAGSVKYNQDTLDLLVPVNVSKKM